MANYSPTFPTGVPVDNGLKEFIANFYGVSDTRGKNKEWVDFFRDDAILVMEKKVATGTTGDIHPSNMLGNAAAGLTGRRKPEILQIREGMWEKVEARKHTVSLVFPASFDDSHMKTGAAEQEEVVELALFGSVAYKLKTGTEDGADWAGHAKLVRANSAKEWKFAYYRVYIQR